MSGNQRYQLQIAKLRELIAYLRQFDGEIQKMVNNYRTKLLALTEQGLPVEIGEKFINDFFQQSKNLSNKNSAVINDQAIPLAMRNIQGLEQLIAGKYVS